MTAEEREKEERILRLFAKALKRYNDALAEMVDARLNCMRLEREALRVLLDHQLKRTV